jgi:hypothetical protein
MKEKMKIHTIFFQFPGLYSILILGISKVKRNRKKTAKKRDEENST